MPSRPRFGHLSIKLLTDLLATHWMLVLVPFLALIPYVRIVGHSFLSFDDQLYVTQNYEVRSGLSLHTIAWAFTATEPTNWHPLTLLSHAFDCTLYGVTPWGHYTTNLVLHAANSLILFLLLYRVSCNRWRAFFVAAIFAVHPFNVETVAWIASRKGLLSSCFAFLALLAYVRYARAPRLKFYIPVLGFTVLGLLAKPMVVTLPFTMLLLDYWPLRRSLGRSGRDLLWLVWEKIPLFLLAGASCIVTYLVHAQGRAFHNFSLEARLTSALTSYLVYAAKAFWPTGLCVYYPHPGETINWLGAAGGGVLLLGVGILASLVARSRPWFVFGWLWFVGTLIPVIGIVPIDGNSMADRYAYIPLIGLFVILAWSWPESFRVKRPVVRWLALLPICVVLALSVCTWQQTRHWRNSKTLFERALSVTGRNAFAEAGLGEALIQEGNLKGAVARLTAALEIEPRSSDALNSLGVALLRLGRNEKAIERLREAVLLSPQTPWYRSNLADVLARQGKADEAYREYKEALRLDQKSPQALCGIGVIELGRGNLPSSVDHLRKAILVDPDYALGHTGLGVALARQGKLDEGAGHLRIAVELAPGVDTHANLGIALLRIQRLAEAETFLRKAVAEQPGHVEARSSLGLALGLQGQFKEAITELRKALASNPDHVSSLYHLAVALAHEGKLKEALSYAEQAYALDPVRPGLKQTLDQLKADLDRRDAGRKR